MGCHKNVLVKSLFLLSALMPRRIAISQMIKKKKNVNAQMFETEKAIGKIWILWIPVYWFHHWTTMAVEAITTKYLSAEALSMDHLKNTQQYTTWNWVTPRHSTKQTNRCWYVFRKGQPVPSVPPHFRLPLYLSFETSYEKSPDRYLVPICSSLNATMGSCASSLGRHDSQPGIHTKKQNRSVKTGPWILFERYYKRKFGFQHGPFPQQQREETSYCTPWTPLPWQSGK